MPVSYTHLDVYKRQARNPLVRLLNPVTLDFLDGEHIAIAGPNGAGKSLLVDLLTGKYPLRDGDVYKRQVQ